MEPAHIDHTGFRLGGKHGFKRGFTDAFKGGSGRQKQRQSSDDGVRLQAFCEHPLYQFYGFRSTFMHVDVRVVVTSEHTVKQIGHGLRDVAMQIKTGNHRYVRSNHIANTCDKVAFEIGQTIDYPGAVEGKIYTVRLFTAQTVKYLLLEGLKSRPFYGA